MYLLTRRQLFMLLGTIVCLVVMLASLLLFTLVRWQGKEAIPGQEGQAASEEQEDGFSNLADHMDPEAIWLASLSPAPEVRNVDEDEPQIIMGHVRKLRPERIPLSGKKDSAPGKSVKSHVSESPPKAVSSGKTRGGGYSGVGLTAWRGGSSMPYEALRKMIIWVTRTLGRKEDHLVPFLLEICAVESDFGMIVRQKGGKALSPWQIMPSSWDYVMNRLRNVNPERYRIVRSFYRDDWSQYRNRTENLAYACASVVIFMETAFPKGYERLIGSVAERGRMWKQYYNTPAGKGTTMRYVKKAHEFVWQRTNMEVALLGNMR